MCNKSEQSRRSQTTPEQATTQNEPSIRASLQNVPLFDEAVAAEQTETGCVPGECHNHHWRNTVPLKYKWFRYNVYAMLLTASVAACVALIYTDGLSH